MVSSKNEFNIVANEMVKDSIDEFEECIEKIRTNYEYVVSKND